MPSVKGTILVPLIKALRARREDARAALPRELHHYLEERVLLTAWYPEHEHLTMLRVLGKLLSLNSYVTMGTVLAQFELNGVYRAQLHEGDAMRTIRGFTQFWPINHDTGTIEIVERDGGASVILSGYVIIAREICEIISGYVEEAVRMAIGRAPQVSHARCRANHAATCVWEIDLPKE
jgi:hypothetical protein